MKSHDESKAEALPSDIFNSYFLKLSNSQICEKIKSKGYVYIENALSEEFLDQIEFDVSNYKFSANENVPSGTYTYGQYYFVNLLQISRSFYNYVTSKFVGDLCTSFFGDKFRLKALRYYETYGKFHMQWHTDNKTDKGFAEIPGLIFIFYVSNVNDGEFQYIEGSHNWSNTKAYNDYSDDYISKNHADKIRSFKGNRGSLIIYNTYGVHRAKPSNDPLLIRKSVFFQVDSEIENSEPIFLNTSFHNKKEAWVDQFLGFGLPQTYEVFPKSNVGALPFKLKFRLAKKMAIGVAIELVRRNRPIFNMVRAIKRKFRY